MDRGNAERALAAALTELGLDARGLQADTELEALGMDSFDVLAVIEELRATLGVEVETEALRGLRTVGGLVEALLRAPERP